jgi:hypothetical protein
MGVKQLLEWKLAGETEVLEENSPPCYFLPLLIQHGLILVANRTAVVESLMFAA